MYRNKGWKEKKKNTKLSGRSPQANFTDRATAASSAKLLQTFAGTGYCVVSATNPHGR
jgi:hypothetical protein